MEIAEVDLTGVRRPSSVPESVLASLVFWSKPSLLGMIFSIASANRREEDR